MENQVRSTADSMTEGRLKVSAGKSTKNKKKQMLKKLIGSYK